MSFLSSLFSTKSNDEPAEQEAEKKPAKFPETTVGMNLGVTIQDGKALLSGKLSAISEEEGYLVIERNPGQLAFNTCEPGTEAVIRGYNKNNTMPFDLKGIVEVSTRVVLKVRELEVIPYDEQRSSFRLSVKSTVQLFYREDERLQNPETCSLVDISIGGACIQSEFLHAEGEVLRLKVQIEEYSPMTYLGQIIRVQEPTPGLFRYGFLFAQLDEQEITALTKILFNIQVGNKKPWQRTENPGYWN